MVKENNPDIIYTKVDEAPELASASLLPIINKFVVSAGLNVGCRDISLAGRIIAAMAEFLKPEQKRTDDLAFLGKWVKTPEANLVKLPNISASIPQLRAAIRELQGNGFNVPDYPDYPNCEREKTIVRLYDAVKGSAVNPILREGNSDRRSASSVKLFAMKNPHSIGEWSKDSRTHVSSMSSDDFFSNEKSATLDSSQAGIARIEFETKKGDLIVLKDGLKMTAGSVVDASFMSLSKLRGFFHQQISEAIEQGVLFSVHLKATMMKVSDPIIFGQAVSAVLEPFIAKHKTVLDELGFDCNLGLSDLEARLSTLDTERYAIVNSDLSDCLTRAKLYMVNSERGITNFHVSSDVIIDASMPALIRSGGKAWGADGTKNDCKCVIPDSSYAPVYDEAISFFKANGALDPATCGSVSNVGLMAQKAEEYGSHATTFQMEDDGFVRFVLENGDVLHEHEVKAGDIWRSSITQRSAIEDWIKLGIERQRATGSLAIFWLDAKRPHDAQLIRYVNKTLDVEKKENLNFKIMSPRAATNLTLKHITCGHNCISITGNVLRDYLTDLFPILELGTSAKMLSIVKLMNGGCLFETGAGGSAPKHVQQLIEEGHLRWDSLGEFCALGESLKFLSENSGNKKAGILGTAVDEATQLVLEKRKSPGRKVGSVDTRHSHFYFALFWAEAIAFQSEDPELASYFQDLAVAMRKKEGEIVNELSLTQGIGCDLGGYYLMSPEKVEKVMRPSKILNRILK